MVASMVVSASLLQEFGEGGRGGGLLAGVFGCGFTIVWLALVVAMIAGMWKVFTKAGQPGWAAVVPIYNLVVLLQIVGKPLWWIVLFFIPLVNIIAAIMVSVVLAERFGKEVGFAIGLILLPFIFYPVLGFGSATYRA